MKQRFWNAVLDLAVILAGWTDRFFLWAYAKARPPDYKDMLQ